MYSVTAPVPGRVRAIADGLHPVLASFEHVREDHSLLLKRIRDDRDAATVGRTVARSLEGAPAVEARITGIDAFSDPPIGPAPVVYLAVESPGLERIHERLAGAFDPVEGLEGPDYIPHVTLARGGDPAALEPVLERSVEPVTWTVSEVAFADGSTRLPITRIGLPA